MTNYDTATESELRELPAPKCNTAAELAAFVESMASRPHDYGTCVYAMSLCAEAAFRFIADRLGVTGFQASCADMDFIKRTRGMKHGFQLLDYSKLLFPQYASDMHITPETLLAEPSLRTRIRAEAKKNLAEKSGAHEHVVAHWEELAELPVLDGERATS